MKLRLDLILGISFVIIGTLTMIISAASNVHWNSETRYWENQTEFYYDYWVEHSNPAAWQNYLEAQDNAINADRKASDCIWGYIIGMILILAGIFIMILMKIRTERLNNLKPF